MSNMILSMAELRSIHVLELSVFAEENARDSEARALTTEYAELSANFADLQEVARPFAEFWRTAIGERDDEEIIAVRGAAVIRVRDVRRLLELLHMAIIPLRLVEAK